MLVPFIIYDYLVWHYTRAWREIVGVWWNLLWYVTHLFSIPQLLRSWFAPFKRMTEDKQAGFSFEQLASRIIINILTRVVGALIRTCIIVCGLTALILTGLGGVGILILWAFFPFLIIGGFVGGLTLIITSV